MRMRGKKKQPHPQPNPLYLSDMRKPLSTPAVEYRWEEPMRRGGRGAVGRATTPGEPRRLRQLRARPTAVGGGPDGSARTDRQCSTAPTREQRPGRGTADDTERWCQCAGGAGGDQFSRYTSSWRHEASSSHGRWRSCAFARF